MQNDRATDELRKKIDGLDTLSGGIVYGKEEAWEKLQQRIERKPAMRIAIKPIAAAAAMLLLLVIAAGIYLTSASHDNSTITQSNNTVVNTPATQPTTQPVDELTSPVVIEKATGNSERYKTELSVAKDDPKQIETETQQAPPTDEARLTTAPNVVPVAIAATAVPKKMRVVHINDLNREQDTNDEPQEVAANNIIDISKLPMVHISEVVHEEYEVQRLRQENRLGIEHKFFLWKNRMDAGSNRSDDNNVMYRPRNWRKAESAYQDSY